MREILFRGKRVDNGEWIEGGYAENGGKTFIIVRTRYIPDTRDWDTVEYYENNPCYHLSMIEVDPENVCQYTGLTDKNGRKIFEGDIVRDIFNASVVGIVRYGEYRNTFNDDEHGGHVGFYVEWKEKRDLLRKDLVYWVKNSEFIGNTFDNPELIGEQP